MRASGVEWSGVEWAGWAGFGSYRTRRSAARIRKQCQNTAIVEVLQRLSETFREKKWLVCCAACLLCFTVLRCATSVLCGLGGVPRMFAVLRCGNGMPIHRPCRGDTRRHKPLGARQLSYIAGVSDDCESESVSGMSLECSHRAPVRLNG